MTDPSEQSENLLRHLSSRRLLVLDDDASILATLTRMASKLGCEVRVCASVDEFADAIDTFEPHLVLVDLMMPDVDGIDVLESMQPRPQTAVYVMTGAGPRTIEASRQVLRNSGISVTGFLSKPFSVSDLRNILDAPQYDANCQQQTKSPTSRPQLLTSEQFKRAVYDERVEPFFQPIFHADCKRLKGFEALARVRGQGSSYFAPEYLKQLVDDAHLSKHLSGIIMSKSLACLSSLDLEYPLTVSINIFGLDAVTEGFQETLKRHCDSHGVAHEQVILELSEAAVFRFTAEDLRKITKLRLAGFGLSIDDLGTGHSSLERLTGVPFTELKIDRSFCGNVLRSDAALAVVEACLGLGHRLGMKVTAEGVEDSQIAQFLQKAGCDYLQGHYFSQALAPEHIQPWIDEGCPRYAS